MKNKILIYDYGTFSILNINKYYIINANTNIIHKIRKM